LAPNELLIVGSPDHPDEAGLGSAQFYDEVGRGTRAPHAFPQIQSGHPVEQVQSPGMDYLLDLTPAISAFTEFTPYIPFREIRT
jgi:hypothetical protein